LLFNEDLTPAVTSCWVHVRGEVGCSMLQMLKLVAGPRGPDVQVSDPVLLLRDGLEDPLDDAGLVQQQLDQLSTIGRCEYEKTCALLVQLFDQAAQSYQELLQATNASAADVTVQEGG